ncbi:unnamed protein product [Hydatigera taeniaeformis]|uniref:BSD domain-containing protein n=1 Tax=Hydatigena taeniaeformis TaxID=6205 RepID=A0A3P7EHR4_HYDTA|nr:unnamed protein product [Hydatigera taeniaeformis]
MPSSQKDVLSYSEWRTNFFDEHTYCPRPDTPVFEGCSLPTTAPATTVTYPPPSQVLEASPIVRSHLLRLVDPDGGGNLGEADFWSRYYYRVWCFDVLDLKRTRLAQINAASVAAVTSEEVDEVEAWPDLEVEEEIEETGDVAIVTSETEKSPERIELSDTMANPLVEAQLPKNSSTEFSSPASSVVMVTKEEVLEEGDDDEEEETTQKSPPVSSGGDEYIEQEEENGIQLSVEYLQEEAAKLRVELGSEVDDTSETGSDWEKWA